MQIPSHYLKVQVFTYIYENLAVILILQFAFQNHSGLVTSIRDVLLFFGGMWKYFFLINF